MRPTTITGGHSTAVRTSFSLAIGWALAALASVNLGALAQGPDGPPPGPDGPGGPPAAFGGPGGPGMGGPRFGGPMQEEVKVVKRFDKDGDGRLNLAERQTARESLSKERPSGGMMGGPRFGPRGGNTEPVVAGAKLAAADVKNYPEAAAYDPSVLRTVFLKFEEPNWEETLAAFKNTDVEVPAQMIIDGKTYADVGVHFRGMSSYGMVSEGRKRSLNLALDFVHKDQNFGGYRTLNLLNAHEDPSFLRAVLYLQAARDYLPSPKANLVRVVINGESWGIYTSVQQFNKDFTKEAFGSTKGNRWKVTGNPGGGGSLAYLGDDVASYRRLYEIKTKDDPKSWAGLIQLCKVLNETPATQLETALTPLLDVDGALRFLALENTLINNDGYWIRASDYSLYQDEKGVFHVLIHDANEAFARPGGPGFGGGPGGRGGFGPGMFLAPQWLSQGDKDGDKKLSRTELSSLAGSWFDSLSEGKSEPLNQERFAANLGTVLPPPQGFGPAPGGGRGAPGPGPGPGMFIGGGLFTALDANKDGTLSREEMKEMFAKWADTWDASKSGTVNEDQIREGLNQTLASGFGGGRQRRQGGPPGFGGGASIKGVELDPLFAANDATKPLISKLLAVPAWRAKYLGYVRDIAEKWLDWQRVGPIAQKYHDLIAADVQADTHKLDSTEAFEKSLSDSGATEAGAGAGGGFPGREAIGLKVFAEQRRTYLLNLPGVKDAVLP
ncbi:MAG: CotH kinase family protein [Verrucomicrobiales bacterium]|nr:CotH kinase family protein [Verrucomicrobiales bacterium]